MSAEKYVSASAKNVEEALVKRNRRLPTKCYTPLATDYRPELETLAELKANGIQYYQELIGVLRWAVKLGRVDILLETALMLTHWEERSIGPSLLNVRISQDVSKTETIGQNWKRWRS